MLDAGYRRRRSHVVERNASGAMPEEKLTFLFRTMGQSVMINIDTQSMDVLCLDINKRLGLLDNDSGFSKRWSKGRDLRYAGVSREGAGSGMDNWTSGTAGVKECRDLNQLNESREETIPHKECSREEEEKACRKEKGGVGGSRLN